MTVVGIIAVVALSLMLTGIFVLGLRAKGPWGSGWSFFVIIALSLSTVSLWVPPAGPVWYGAPLVDLVITGLLVSFVLSAVTPSGQYQSSTIKSDSNNNESFHKAEYNEFHKLGRHTKSPFDVGSFFWMLLLVLSVLIILGAV